MTADEHAHTRSRLALLMELERPDFDAYLRAQCRRLAPLFAGDVDALELYAEARAITDTTIRVMNERNIVPTGTPSTRAAAYFWSRWPLESPVITLCPAVHSYSCTPPRSARRRRARRRARRGPPTTSPTRCAR